MKTLREGRFVALRPRVEGEHPVAGLRAWQRLKLSVALEVSEILEVFMVTSQSDLFGLVPRSMEKIARSALGLRTLKSAQSRRPCRSSSSGMPTGMRIRGTHSCVRN